MHRLWQSPSSISQGQVLFCLCAGLDFGQSSTMTNQVWFNRQCMLLIQNVSGEQTSFLVQHCHTRKDLCAEFCFLRAQVLPKLPVLSNFKLISGVTDLELFNSQNDLQVFWGFFYNERTAGMFAWESRPAFVVEWRECGEASRATCNLVSPGGRSLAQGASLADLSTSSRHQAAFLKSWGSPFALRTAHRSICDGCRKPAAEQILSSSWLWLKTGLLQKWAWRRVYNDIASCSLLIRRKTPTGISGWNKSGLLRRIKW